MPEKPSSKPHVRPAKAGQRGAGPFGKYAEGAALKIKMIGSTENYALPGSDDVKASLPKGTKAQGRDYLFVVRKGPNRTVSAKTLGRLVGDRAGRDLKIEPVEPALTPAFEADAFQPDAKAQALLAGVEQAKADLTNAGGAYTLEQVCALLGDISRQAVHNRVREGALFSVKAPGGRVAFPTLQFTSEGPVEGLSALVKAFPSKNRWMLLNFLVHSDDRLGNRRPIDVLKTGEVDLVVEAARTLGEHGA